MAMSNIGPELPEPSDALVSDRARRGNPSFVYGDDVPGDDVVAASTRASVITQRFGGVRHVLIRPGAPFTPAAPVFEPDPAPAEEPPAKQRRPFWMAWPWQPTLELPVDRPLPDGGESDSDR